MIWTAAAALFQVTVSDEWIERATRAARPVSACEVGPDCDAKRDRARRWIAENSRFAIARDDDGAIVTQGAIYASTEPSVAVVFEPARDGRRTIRFRAWCGNVFLCAPSPRQMRRLFVQAIEDVPR